VAYSNPAPSSGDVQDPLASIETFSRLEPEVRRRLAAAMEHRTYRKGQTLFEEGDQGDTMIVLLRGAVAVFRTSPTGQRALLTVLRHPDVIGEVSLLDGSTRSASAQAIEDSTALVLRRTAFLELVSANPVILDAVVRSLGALIRRLTEMNADHVFLDLPGRVAKYKRTILRGDGLLGSQSEPVGRLSCRRWSAWSGLLGPGPAVLGHASAARAA
jgi:CRP/FNR family transcriptional regulator, cyclic AMP receptor protein